MLKAIEPIAYPLIKRFYSETRYGGSPGKNERVWAWYREQTLLGCVRLQPYDGALFLRAMVVHPSYRGQGVGRDFLSEVVAQYRDQPIFCFPFAHLEKFYAEAGFELTDTLEDPPWFQQYYQRLHQQRDIVAMRLIRR